LLNRKYKKQWKGGGTNRSELAIHSCKEETSVIVAWPMSSWKVEQVRLGSAIPDDEQSIFKNPHKNSNKAWPCPKNPKRFNNNWIPWKFLEVGKLTVLD